MNVKLTEAESEGLIEAIQNGDQDAYVERLVAARLAAVEALGQDGSPGSLMEDIRAELTAVTGDPGIASALNTRVMHQIREHIRAALRADPSEARWESQDGRGNPLSGGTSTNCR